MAKYIIVLMISIFVFVGGRNTALAGPFILIDAHTETVLAAHNPTDPWYPASITKLMTLYVAVEAIRNGELSLTSTLTMSRNASRTAPSKMGFKPGTKVTMANALQMLTVKSANDIAVGIAERISGSVPAFAARMNETAQRLGMTSTHFVNPHGLPNNEQIVTARDMAVLGLALHKNFPEVLPIFQLAGINFGKRTLRSHNLLVEHYRGASGMKTGYICAGGLNLVGSARRGGRELIVVVLGELTSIDRGEMAALVLEHGFNNSFKGSHGNLAEFTPTPTRTTPVNMRPLVCGGHRKIRKFQIVAPQPRPEKKLLKRSKYTSPQRKNFGANLGDDTHPQGALIGAPGRRKYRSHILQPREAGALSRVYAGPHRGNVPVPFNVHVSEEAKQRLARQRRDAEQQARTDGKPSPDIPLPRPNPGVQRTTEGADRQASNSGALELRPRIAPSASAFQNAANGTNAVRPASAASSLHR